MKQTSKTTATNRVLTTAALAAFWLAGMTSAWAADAQNCQVLRTFRNDPAASDGFGWTYHHEPMITYWKGRFCLAFKTNPADEDMAPGCVLLSTSDDEARTWSSPTVLFPAREVAPGDWTFNAMRLGFWIAPAGRLHAMADYIPQSGYTSGNYCDWLAYGVAVREIRTDGTFGPIHFVVENPTLYPRESLPFPYYTASTDAVFKADCEALRADKIATLSWWEPIRPENFAFPKSLTDFIFSRTVAQNRAKFAKWLDSADPEIVANALIRLCDRADFLTRKQLDAQGERFLEEGGFKERLTRVRSAARVEPQAPARNAASRCGCEAPARARAPAASSGAARTTRNATGCSMWTSRNLDRNRLQSTRVDWRRKETGDNREILPRPRSLRSRRRQAGPGAVYHLEQQAADTRDRAAPAGVGRLYHRCDGAGCCESVRA